MLEKTPTEEQLQSMMGEGKFKAWSQMTFTKAHVNTMMVNSST